MTKQKLHLWVAEGKMMASLLWKSILKYRTAKKQMGNQNQTQDLNLWKMQYEEEKKRKNKGKQSCDIVLTIKTIPLKYLFKHQKQRKSFHPFKFYILQNS